MNKNRDPKIIVAYESLATKEASDMPFSEYEDFQNSGGGGKAERGRPVVLKNLSDIAAVNVQIQDIVIGQLRASFHVIPRIVLNEPASLHPTIEGITHPISRHNLDILLAAACDARRVGQITIPIMVSYTDIYGRAFETGSEITYGGQYGVTKTLVKQYGRVSNWPKFLIRGH